MAERAGVGKWIQGFEGVAEVHPGEEPLHSMAEILAWLEERKSSQRVRIGMISLAECDPWEYDEGEGSIRRRDGSFFSICGVEAVWPDGRKSAQPMILQPEIGYLGIVCKKIRGLWHFLMQAKIEPGNINHVQISPTIQATKSNFTRRHGGKEPPYLDLFRRMSRRDILVDQIQSEQSSRFLGKRNRNVIIRTEEDIPELPSHRWMTLGQIRACMRVDNLVNMDTRTVFSCMPYVFMMDSVRGYAPEFMKSMSSIRHPDMIDIYLRANNYKMFQAPEIRRTPLLALPGWGFEGNRFRAEGGAPFDIVFCRLNIEGREVVRWNQPLFAARGKATFGLICRVREGKYEALVSLRPEAGCFDTVELGPSVQEEPGAEKTRDSVAEAFFEKLGEERRVMTDVILSEEGGRFYHEQNRNVILRTEEEILFDPDRYVWAALGTLNALTQLNNCLNIQLRNLLMLFSMLSEEEAEAETAK